MRKYALALASLVVLVACDDGTTPPDPEALTFYEDVAPIFAENCLGCHSEGGIGPFELVTYEDAAEWPTEIRASVMSRAMPPFKIDNSGDCHTYRDARWLTDEEMNTIAGWIDTGMAEGDPANAPEVPAPPTLGDEANVTLDMGVTYAPTGDGDDYRCFVIDPENDEDVFITGFEMHPGEPRTVHHMLLFALDDEEAIAEAADLDAADDIPGYRCFGGPRAGDGRFLAGWAPGGPPTRYPANTGVRLVGGSKVVMQLHYNLAAGPLPDRSRLDLITTPEVSREGQVVPVVDSTFALPPRERYVTTTASEMDAVPLRLTVHGVAPHMHTLGRTLRVDLLRDGEEMCAANVPEYDFNWQQFFMYEEPIRAKPGDGVKITCGYDTSTRDSMTRWGDGTEDEMCLAYLYVTVGW